MKPLPRGSGKMCSRKRLQLQYNNVAGPEAWRLIADFAFFVRPAISR